MLRYLDRRARIQLALTALAAASLLKNVSHTSCLWDLAEFGGVANYVSHWNWALQDGGPRRCFRGGHASNAFAYVSGWFVLRGVAPRAAAAWIGVALTTGCVPGIAQQWRGAHYMSHTLWTAWICWSVAFAIDAVAVYLCGRPNLNKP